MGISMSENGTVIEIREKMGNRRLVQVLEVFFLGSIMELRGYIPQDAWRQDYIY